METSRETRAVSLKHVAMLLAVVAAVVPVDAVCQDSAARAAQLQDLSARLASSSFSERTLATRMFRRFGVEGHATLSQIAIDGDVEAVDRAMKLLMEAFGSEDFEVSSSAAYELSQIAQSQSHSAKWAKNVLDPPQPTSVTRGQLPPQVLRLLNQRNILLGQRNLNLGVPAFGGGGAGNLRMTIRTVNGKKEVRVHWKNRSYRFFRNTKGLHVGQTKNGKPVIDTYQSSAALKTADRQAWEAFQKAGGDRTLK